MKLPQRPPQASPEILSEAMKHFGRKDVQELIRKANAEYYHWDELRRRPGVPDVADSVLWHLVKLTRMSERRWLPLTEHDGPPFNYWLPPHAMQTLHAVDRWGGSTLALDGAISTSLEGMKDQMIVSSLMEEAIATSQIEGAATTRQVAKKMLRDNRAPRNRSEQMVFNSYRTMQMLRERKDVPLSVELLLEIQSHMTEETLDDPSAAGRLRTGDDEIAVIDIRDNEVIFTPPPAELLPKRLEKLIRFANAPATESEFIHPLVKASILHFWLAYEHPFVDGNGRTARAVFYWFMLKNGYWLFEFLTVSRAIMSGQKEYYRSFLFSENDSQDLTYSLLFQIKATKRAIENLRKYMQVKQEEQRQIASRLRNVPGLNHRQRGLLDHALRNPDEPISFQSHRTVHNVTYVTARSDILDLLRRNLLVDDTIGRQRVFWAAENLPAKVKASKRSP